MFDMSGRFVKVIEHDKWVSSSPRSG